MYPMDAGWLLSCIIYFSIFFFCYCQYFYLNFVGTLFAKIQDAATNAGFWLSLGSLPKS